MAGQIKAYPTTKNADSPTEITYTGITGDKSALDVNLAGGSVTSTPGGGGVSSGVTTEVTTVNDAGWVAVPPTATAGRAGFSIQNQSGVQIKINFGTPAGYVGVILENGGERFYDANDTAVIYARSVGGSGTISGIIIEELVP
jgi:hypothetical protein